MVGRYHHMFWSCWLSTSPHYPIINMPDIVIVSFIQKRYNIFKRPEMVTGLFAFLEVNNFGGNLICQISNINQSKNEITKSTTLNSRQNFYLSGRARIASCIELVTYHFLSFCFSIFWSSSLHLLFTTLSSTALCSTIQLTTIMTAVEGKKRSRQTFNLQRQVQLYIISFVSKPNKLNLYIWKTRM